MNLNTLFCCLFSQAVREESTPVFIEDEEEDIESALAFAQKRREQMILPEFQFDDKGSVLSTGKWILPPPPTFLQKNINSPSLILFFLIFKLLIFILCKAAQRCLSQIFHDYFSDKKAYYFKRNTFMAVLSQDSTLRHKMLFYISL